MSPYYMGDKPQGDATGNLEISLPWFRDATNILVNSSETTPMKPSFALLATTLLVLPLPAIAQEQSDENPVEMVQTELIGLLKSKGFDNTKLQQISANDDAIVIDGLTGSNSGRAFEFGRIEIKGIDAGYRWTRASQLSFSNVNLTFGSDTFHADAVLSNGFGILDVDSGQPGFAFDELAVVNGHWKRGDVSLVTVPSLVATGRQWKELYSIPATLNIKASVTFSGQALLALLGQMSLPVEAAEPPMAADTYSADVTARLSSTTSSGSLSVSLTAKTDKLGDHKFETTLGGFDDSLLESYFARGDENVVTDQEKLNFLKSELNRHIADISVRTLFYHGERLTGLASAFSSQTEAVIAASEAWVERNSSEKQVEKNKQLITAPLSKFLDTPNVLEVDIIPQRGVTLSTLAEAVNSQPQGPKLLDVLGAKVVAR